MSLKERREVVLLYRDAVAAPADGALFSVVGVAGSSYRQPGARMLVLSDKRTAGTLSGGCLEADLLRRAAWTVRSGAVVERFSTAFDDTAEIPYGLGCGGEVDLLAEPLQTPEAAALLAAMEATLHQQERTVATLLPVAAPGTGSTPLRRIVLDASGDVLFASEALPTEEVVSLRNLVHRGRLAGDGNHRPAGQTATALDGLFVEWLAPVQRLVIFGAGEDARPLSRLAQEMGWQSVVADARAQRATPDRFPGAECVVCSSAADVPVTSLDAVVLMTHSYVQDRELLAELLPVPPRYLGLLGARHRSALLLHEASLLASVSLPQAVEATNAPIGLELGGEGPEAVALAIVAEIQHALAGRRQAYPVGSRRLHQADVERLLEEGPAATVYQNCVLTVGDPGALVAEVIA